MNAGLCERVDQAVSANSNVGFVEAIEALANEGTGTPRVLANQLIDAINAGDKPEAGELVGRLYDACLDAGMAPAPVGVSQ